MEKICVMMILELDNYSAFGTSGSGNQLKFWVDNKLIKIDSKYKESDKEVSASILAELFGLSCVKYYKSKVMYLGDLKNCCYCLSYLNKEIEEEITVYQILQLKNVNIDRNESSISFYNKTVNAIYEITHINIDIIRNWILSIVTFDFLICNFDRHLSNFCIIHNIKTSEYRLGPIFDNGQSFLNTNGDLTYSEIESRCRKLKMRPFSTNQKSNLLDINSAKYLASLWKERCLFKYEKLSDIEINAGHNKIFRYRLDKLMNI